MKGLTMFDKINNPRELFGHQLGAALTMEHDVLDMLGDLEEKARQAELKRQFSHHAKETRQQIDNIEQVFRALGEEPDDSPSQVTKALDKEAKANIKMAAEDDLVDAVILSGAAETEHHEIAVYESLLAQAEHLGKPEITRLLQQNLEIEQHTLEEVKQQQRQLATAAA